MRVAVILFSVSVPVLSVQITDAAPKGFDGLQAAGKGILADHGRCAECQGDRDDSGQAFGHHGDREREAGHHHFDRFTAKDDAEEA